MKTQTLKRLVSHISSFDYTQKCLNILDTHDWVICVSKNGTQNDFPTNHLLSINKECQLDFFVYNKKMFNKQIFLSINGDFDKTNLEIVKSPQLLKKIQLYIGKWRTKLVKRLQCEWKHISKNSFVKTDYFKECLTTADKKHIQQILSEKTDTEYDTLPKENNMLQKKVKSKKKELNTQDLSNSEVKKIVKEKIQKIKNKNIQVHIGNFWEYPDQPKVFKNDFNQQTVVYLNEKEFSKNQDNTEFQDNHCQTDNLSIVDVSEKSHKTYNTLSTQTKSISLLTQETQTNSIIHCECCTHNKKLKQNDVVTQTDYQDTFDKGKMPLNLKFDHLMSESGVLGLPASKRSKELANIYNELNSTFGKIKKVCGRRQITTPGITYVSYRLFEQFEGEIQNDVIKQYKEIVKLFKLLRVEFVETQKLDIFTDKISNILASLQTRIVILNNNIQILDSKCKELEIDQLTTVVITEQDKQTEIHGIIGDYNLEDTPLEGSRQSSQQVLEFDDDLLGSLLQ